MGNGGSTVFPVHVLGKSYEGEFNPQNLSKRDPSIRFLN